MVKEKFKEIKSIIKIQEAAAETILSKNIEKIEGQFKTLRDIPKKLYEDTDKWLKAAQKKLDGFA